MNPQVREGEADLAIVREAVTAPGPVGLPACPLMHGTGLFVLTLAPHGLAGVMPAKARL